MRRFGFLLLTLALATASVGAGDTPVRLATTTSTDNSGLLQFLLPQAEAALGFKVHVIAVGSGKALKLGENGDVDIILSHAPELEARFIEDGWGIDRRPVMYNDFILVGPAADPAKVRQASSAGDAFARIAAAKQTFVSRGDDSGTHLKEQTLWRAAGVMPAGGWYVSAGRGQGATLLMAEEMQGYTLSDRGTYLTFKRRDDLPIVYENDPPLMNPYSMILVNPARHAHVQHDRGRRLLDWFTSAPGQQAIGSFVVEGQVLFHPGSPR